MSKFSNLLTALTAAVVMFGHSTGFAHGEERVSIEAVTQGTLTASDKIEFVFKLQDEVAKKSVGELDLKESHTKKLHLVVYDASLNEFNHVHPTFDGEFWKAELNLTTDGSYFIWAQGTLLDGTEFSASYQVGVTDGKPALTVVSLGNIRKASVGNTVVELSKEKVRAGKMAMIIYTVSHIDGTQPDVTQYLGANAHIIAVSPDGTDLIHAHPMDGNDNTTGMIHVTFPTEGDYRIWVQVIDAGVLKTVPLSVTVLKK
ncbi:hypothetical protein CIK05_11210 [Bdellovibrio sp. qaytius]|nr:hypothetical protein CIK05_11210 [Bdellovibrio sp. qaytius]